MEVEESAKSRARGRGSGIRVTVTIYGIREDRALALTPGAKVRDAISALGMDRGAVGIVVRDGKIASEEDELRDEDALTLYPPLTGG